jgi:hypothetical protein
MMEEASSGGDYRRQAELRETPPTERDGRSASGTVIVEIGLLGFVMAWSAHAVCRLAERRAKDAYRELVGDKAPTIPNDKWQAIRPLIGRWGCILPLMEFIRGVGILLAAGAAVHLITGP